MGDCKARRQLMRAILIAAAVAGAASMLTTTDAKAQYSAWCSEYSRGGGTNCGFYTFDQCLANISGIGGRCYPNPYIAAGPGFDGTGVYGPGRVHRRPIRKKRPRR
jgi:uncharacterized protein DUF3551